MDYANVLINLPALSLNQVFTYAIPDRFKGKIGFGQRVLVEFGQRNVEAYVIDIKKETNIKNVKNIVHILDNIPLINTELYELANFMAEHYLCPIALALNAMVPKAITKSRAQVLIPLIKVEESDGMPSLAKYKDFFQVLWRDNEISLVDSKQYIQEDDIEYLTSLGLIKVIYKYTKKPLQQKGYMYSINPAAEQIDIEKLSKRSPRQAELLQLLLKNNLPCEWVDKKFNKSTLNALIKKGQISKEIAPTIFKDSQINLTAEQKVAVNTVNAAIDKGTQEFLLFGVTGSGKTEVYLNIAQHYIEKGKRVLILIPEIALTRHLVDVISLRVSSIAVLHSNMSHGARLEEWERIRNGDVSLVLGTRSAVFAPIPNLGLIIIDEEQEATYKQEETPKYDAREIARERASLNNAVLLYGSATPSLELFCRVQNNEVTMLKLEKRIGNATLPSVHIEDLKLGKNPSNRIITRYLQNKITENLNKNEQTILFINRRGYSPITVCRKCGNILNCPYCSVGLNYHRDLDANICHYCDFKADLSSNCPECDSNYLQQVGTGTQKVEGEVRKLFPSARIERLDLDVSRKGEQKKLLTKMKDKKIDILIGTQMVAKGLDFPNVSLVGIVDADSMLALPDYRAAERTFQLIVQAAGRAGRGDKPGEVVIQTYSPDNPIIQWAAEQNYIKFYFEEIKLRKILKYPPFTSILRIVVADKNLANVIDRIETVVEMVNEVTDAKEEYIQILGPAPCPIEKIRNNYRYQIIIKSDNMLLLNSIGYYIRTEIKFNNVKIDLDINPNTMM